MKHQTKTERIRNCLRQERTRYTELLSHIREQSEAIQVGNESRALGIMERTGALVDSIRELDENIAETVNAIPETDRQEALAPVETLRKDVENLLKEIIALEADSTQIVSQRKTDHQLQLKALKQGKTVMKSYREPPSNRSGFAKNI